MPSAKNLTGLVLLPEINFISCRKGGKAHTIFEGEKASRSEVSNEIQAGQVLDDRFEITDLINRSGMASIFKANDRETGQTVAIKVPLMQFESDAATFSRFEREEEIGKTLNHPYILKIFAVDPEKKSRPYIVMEFLQGQTLGALMREVHPLPERDAAHIASRICEALDHMHAKGSSIATSSRRTS